MGEEDAHIRKYKSWTEEVWERYERITGKQRPEFFKTKTDEEKQLSAKDSFAKDGEVDGHD